MAEILDSEPMLSSLLVCAKCRTSVDAVQTPGAGLQGPKHNHEYCYMHISLCSKCISPFSSRLRKGMGSYEVYSRPSPNQTLARREAPTMMISHCFRKLTKSNNGVIHHVAWLGIHPIVTLVCPLGTNSAIREGRYCKSHAPVEPAGPKAAQRPTS